jgi:hypothetical protein
MRFLPRLVVIWILLISGRAEIACAQLFSFTKVADNSTPIPDGAGTFRGFVSPALETGRVAFWGAGFDQQQGIYSGPIGGPLTRTVDVTMPVPGLGVPLNLVSQEFSLDMGRVAFGGLRESVFGVYTSENGVIDRVADTTTPIPSGSGNFRMLGVPSGFSPSADNGRLVFAAQGDTTPGVQPLRGVYLWQDGALSRIADTTMPVPGQAGNFGVFESAVIGGGSVAFIANDFDRRGVYLHNLDTGVLSRVADRSTPVPGHVETFSNFLALGRGLDVDGGDLAFVGQAQSVSGIYVFDGAAGTLRAITESGMPVPGAAQGQFEQYFNSVSIDGANVAFGYGTSFASIPEEPPPEDTPFFGVWTNLGGSLAKVLDKGDMLDGKLVARVQMGREGLDGDQIALRVEFADETNAVYVATLIPEPATMALVICGCAAMVVMARIARGGGGRVRED